MNCGAIPSTKKQANVLRHAWIHLQKDLKSSYISSPSLISAKAEHHPTTRSRPHKLGVPFPLAFVVNVNGTNHVL